MDNKVKVAHIVLRILLVINIVVPLSVAGVVVVGRAGGVAYRRPSSSSSIMFPTASDGGDDDGAESVSAPDPHHGGRRPEQDRSGEAVAVDGDKPAAGDDDTFGVQWERRELENLTKNILKSLGMKKIPDISKIRTTPEELDKAYQKYYKTLEDVKRRRRKRQTTEEEENEAQSSQKQTTTTQLYTYHDQGGNYPPPHLLATLPLAGFRNGTFSFAYFAVDNLTSVLSDMDLKTSVTARLLLPMAERIGMEGMSANLTLYRVGSQALTAVTPIGAATRDGNGSVVAWDVSAEVRTWLERPNLNHGLVITCSVLLGGGCDKARGAGTADGSLRLEVRVTTSSGEEEHVGGHSRTKRSFDPSNFIMEPALMSQPKNCSKGPGRHHCCRKSMKVSIKDLNMSSWIIQPKDFDAFYCRGKCPYRHNPANTHAIIQYIMHKQKKAPKLCCAPRKFGVLPIMHYDDSNPPEIKITEWKDVIVEECGCT